jgi:hypothetical protein
MDDIASTSSSSQFESLYKNKDISSPSSLAYLSSVAGRTVDELRKNRENDSIQLRKQKREDNLNKRRNIGGDAIGEGGEDNRLGPEEVSCF